MGKDFFEWKR